MPEPTDLPPLEPTEPFDPLQPVQRFEKSPPPELSEPAYLSVDDPLTAAVPARRPVGIVAVAVGVAAMLVAGVAVVSALTGPQTNTPQGAVREMLTAAGNADVLGVLDHLDPAERDAIAPFLTDGVSDLKRLGVLSTTADLNHVAGVTLSFDNVTMTSAPVRSDLEAVTITGGTVHGRLDPKQLPLGPFTVQKAGSSLANAKVTDKTSPLHVSVPIVTLRRGDTWYVSIGYTVAELARHKMNVALPAAGIPALGADSATQAVDDFLRAASRLDVRRLIELTPPDELGALHDYAPLFLPKMTDAIAKRQAGPHAVSITITDLALTAKGHRGGQLVKITKLGVRASSGNTTVELAPGAKCVKLTSTDAVPPVFPGQCGTHAPFGAPFGFSSGGCSVAAIAPGGAPVQSVPICTPPLPDSTTKNPYAGFKALAGIHPDLGIVVVQRGGKWYVSPVRTGFDDLEAFLHALSPDVLHQAIDGAGPLTSVLFLPLVFLGSRTGSTTYAVTSGTNMTGYTPVGGSAPIGRSGPITTTIRPTYPCVGGRRTVQFPAPPTRPGQPAQPPQPPITVPCGPPTPPPTIIDR